MDNRDHSMEEFFRKSMEAFRDTPDDSVWTTIDEQLSADLTLFDKMRYWLVKLAPLLIAGAFVLIYTIRTEREVDMLRTQLQALKQQPSLTSSSLGPDQLTSPIAAAEEANEPSDQFSPPIIENVPQSAVKSVPSEIALSSTTRTTESAPALSLGFTKAGRNSKERSINPLQNKILDSETVVEAKEAQLKTDGRTSTPYAEHTEQVITNELDQPIVDIHSKSENNNIELDSSTNSVRRASKHLFDQAPSLSWTVSHSRRLDFDMTNALAQSLLKSSQSTSKKRKGLLKGLFNTSRIEIPSPFGLDYAFGLTGRAFSTFVADGFHLSPSFSAGISQELGFTERLWITNDIRFNWSSHTIDNGDMLIDAERLANFPLGPLQGGSFRSIEVTDKYIDCSLGLKWIVASTPKRNKYYINPSVACQWYLSQQFEYFIIGNKGFSFPSNRQLLYFGSGNIEIGIEKPLSRTTAFHLGLWFEHSLIEQGVEQEHRAMIGVSTSYIFGK